MCSKWQRQTSAPPTHTHPPHILLTDSSNWDYQGLLLHKPGSGPLTSARMAGGCNFPWQSHEKLLPPLTSGRPGALLVGKGNEPERRTAQIAFSEAQGRLGRGGETGLTGQEDGRVGVKCTLNRRAVAFRAGGKETAVNSAPPGSRSAAGGRDCVHSALSTGLQSTC